MRTYVVTGSSSGIGAATARALRRRGFRVIGVDRNQAEVVADLSTPAGREAMVRGVRRETDVVDGLVAAAGVSGVRTDPATVVAVNYFGVVATLAGLRPLMVNGTWPRAATVSSVALLRAEDDELVEACLRGDETAAVRAAGAKSHYHYAYGATKRALSYWVRRAAGTTAWAGKGILLNAVAPGMVETPMTSYLLDGQEKRAATLERVDQPLGIGTADGVASLLVWLTGDNEFVTGQTIFADGGHESVAGARSLPRQEQRAFVPPASRATATTPRVGER